MKRPHSAHAARWTSGIASSWPMRVTPCRRLMSNASPAPFARRSACTAHSPQTSRGSVWRFWDRSAAPASSWATPSFDDASWASGPGVFGYGESFIVTPVSYGPDPNNKIITTYFRRWFNVAAPSAATRLRAELIYDDGVVVYLNGHEISRLHMPAGTIGPTTLAPGYETSDIYEASDWSAFNGYLVPGANLLAVEVHQAWLTSSDLAFDLALDVTE